MTTINQLMSAAEKRKLEHERAISDSKRVMKEMGERQTTDAEARQWYEAARDCQRKAVDDLKQTETELLQLRELAADEAEYERINEANAQPERRFTACPRTGGGELREYSLADGTSRPVTDTATGTAVPSQWRYADTGRNAALARGQSIGDHEVAREYAARNAERDRIVMGTHGSLSQQIRALTTSGASAIVPTEWSWPIIDKVRNKAVCLNAGVTVVPMPAKVVQVGRLNQDVAPAFKNEGSPVAVSDPGFDYVQLTASSLGALTVASVELLQDSPDADSMLSDAIAKAMALVLDQTILYGQLAAGNEPQVGTMATPYPRGILKNLLDNAAGNVLGGQTNGTTQTAGSMWREIQSLVYSVKRRNEVPGAIVSNDALQQMYLDSYDSTYQPLRMPENLAALPWLTTNGIASFTSGTMTSVATDVFCGDWSQVLLGSRMGIELRLLSERYAENGQVGIMAYGRFDVQLARPSAMGCYRYLKAAA